MVEREGYSPQNEECPETEPPPCVPGLCMSRSALFAGGWGRCMGHGAWGMGQNGQPGSICSKAGMLGQRVRT